MVKADVVIIGGGPAGCSSALSLLTQGFSVAVVTMPRQREKPTETSLPALKQTLHSLGAESALSACEPCFGIVSDWGRKAPILQPGIVSPFGHAWFIHRSRFDACLQKLAQDRGAIWIQAEALSVICEACEVQVKTTGQSVMARWMVIANGSIPWVANITGQQPTRIDTLTAVWARLPMPRVERLLFVEAADFGWWYLCPDENSGVFACFITDASEVRANGVEKVNSWNKQFRTTNIFRRFDDVPGADTVNVISASTTSLPIKHGQSWIAIGDAAVKLDPLGSSGTIIALESGIRATNVIVNALNGNIRGIEEYEHWSNGLVQNFTSQRKRRYAIEALKRGTGFWNRRR